MKNVITAALAVLLTAQFAVAASSTATGVSRQQNPAISLNALFLGQWNDDTPTADENFAKLQEAEIQFSSVVDPFWTADVVLSFHPAHDHDGEEAHGLIADIEVAEIHSTSMPAGFGLTLGKFYAPFGRHAVLHTHQYPFTRAPLAQRMILGDHGLTEIGAKVDWTAPMPWWSEVSVYGVNGDAEIFDAEDRAPVFGARWSNLWDVSDGGTLELGGSYLSGPGALHEDEAGDLAVSGLDLTWKWASVTQSQGPAANISAELMMPDHEHGEGDPMGWFLHAQTRVHRNWWLGAGYGRVDDMMEHHHDEKADHELADWTEWKAAVTFAPSEFSALRAEVSKIEEVDGEMSDLRVSVQWNVTIGSHPAHLY